MPTCVEECLRYVSPVQMTKPRFATRDMVWQGRQFRRGDMFAGVPGGGKLRSYQIRKSTRFRHHAPPEPSPLFRHRRAFLPWFPTRSGGGRDRIRTHLRAFSRYAPRHRTGRSSGANALAYAPSRSCLYDSWHKAAELHLFRAKERALNLGRRRAPDAGLPHRRKPRTPKVPWGSHKPLVAIEFVRRYQNTVTA